MPAEWRLGTGGEPKKPLLFLDSSCEVRKSRSDSYYETPPSNLKLPSFATLVLLLAFVLEAPALDYDDTRVEPATAHSCAGAGATSEPSPLAVFASGQ